MKPAPTRLCTQRASHYAILALSKPGLMRMGRFANRPYSYSHMHGPPSADVALLSDTPRCVGAQRRELVEGRIARFLPQQRSMRGRVVGDLGIRQIGRIRRRPVSYGRPPSHWGRSQVQHGSPQQQGLDLPYPLVPQIRSPLQVHVCQLVGGFAGVYEQQHPDAQGEAIPDLHLLKVH